MFVQLLELDQSVTLALNGSDSLVMDKIYDGEIMRVIGTGKKWTMVDYRGLRGYVQTGSVDFLMTGFVIDMGSDHVGDDTSEHVVDDRVDIVVFKDEVSLLIHRFTLLTHDIVVLQQLFAGIEVNAFYTPLSRVDRLCHGLGFNRSITK